jgi:hypothetical protein
LGSFYGGCDFCVKLGIYGFWFLSQPLI